MEPAAQSILESLSPTPPRSKLEPHREFICELRRRGRTHREVARIFQERLGLSVAPSPHRCREKLYLAKADFENMADIYRKVYNGKRHCIGIALSNLAGVYVDKSQYRQAEKLRREILQPYSETSPANQLNVGIARTRLGRVLPQQRNHSHAQTARQAGYGSTAERSALKLDKNAQGFD